MKKLTWSELSNIMWRFNEEHGYTCKGNEERLKAVVVFTEDSFNAPYTETERSYMFTSDNKHFLPKQCGNSVFADCLDEKDLGVRIDWYMFDKVAPWKVEYCYLINE